MLDLFGPLTYFLKGIFALWLKISYQRLNYKIGSHPVNVMLMLLINYFATVLFLTTYSNLKAFLMWVSFMFHATIFFAFLLDTENSLH